MNLRLSSFIHENICSLIHKRCHLKSYHSDIKWHMTLNNICNVVHSKIFMVVFMVSSVPWPLTTSNFNKEINSCLDTHALHGSLLNPFEFDMVCERFVVENGHQEHKCYNETKMFAKLMHINIFRFNCWYNCVGLCIFDIFICMNMIAQVVNMMFHWGINNKYSLFALFHGNILSTLWVRRAKCEEKKKLPK